MSDHIVGVYISEHGADRYTIVLDPHKYPCSSGRHPCLCLSLDCDSPQGVSQFSECVIGPHLGQEIPFSQLPANVQAHALKRLANV